MNAYLIIYYLKIIYLRLFKIDYVLFKFIYVFIYLFVFCLF